MADPTAYVIRALGFANGAMCPHAGQFLQWFDFEAYGGVGYGEFTTKVSDAKRFKTHDEALTFWNRQSRIMPRRPDGQPNKPLTSLSIYIEPLP